MIVRGQGRVLHGVLSGRGTSREAPPSSQGGRQAFTRTSPARISCR
ncbi:hypothetical protein [Alloactinosynnema sp. L-07]|nr:hypothetical protein [Alloactinosynnema sp. L-07]